MRKSRQSLPAQGWAAVILVAALAGCSTIENVVGPIGNMGSIFSSSPSPNPENPNPSANPSVSADEDCPGATIRQGAGAWAQNAGQGPTNIRYQASIVQIARECALLGDTMTIKVGVEGRVLVGPKGGAGNVTVPLRIALVQEGPQPRPIISKFYAVNVNVPQGATQQTFTQVDDDLTFPLPADKNLERYVIYVGFDAQGAVPPTKTKAAPKAKAAKPAPKKQTKQQTPPTNQSPSFDPPPQQQQQPQTFQQQPQKQTPTFEPPPTQR
jgi:hypothetical protein